MTSLPADPRWTVAIRLEPDERGDLVAAELRVFPTEEYDGDPEEDPRIRGEWSERLQSVPNGGIHVRDLRTFPLSTHVRKASKRAKEEIWKARKDLRERAARLGDSVDPKLQAWIAAVTPQTTEPAGRGVRKNDLDYIVVAVAYLQKLDEGSTRPAADAAAELGGDWNSARVREWMRRARQRDLVTRSGHGVPGGQLTEKAERLLETTQPGTPSP